MRTKTLMTLNPFIVHVLIPRMWSVPVAALLFFWSLSVTSPIVASETTSEPILDYSPRASDTQRQLEEKFNAIPQPAEARRWHRYFTSVPHPAGTERTKQIADPMKKEQAKDLETLCVFSRLVPSKNSFTRFSIGLPQKNGYARVILR